MIQGILLVSILFYLKVRVVDGRISPDCQYYLNMSVGRKVPRPYSMRILVPLLTRLISTVLKVEPKNVMRTIVFLGTAGSVALVYVLTMQVTGSPLKSTVAALALVGTESAIGVWLLFPWLVDSVSVAFVLAALVSMNSPVMCAVFLACSALSKETIFFIGAVGAIILGCPWWVVLPGAGLCAVAAFLPAGPPNTDWLKFPVRYSQTIKMRDWFRYDRNLEGIRATPWLTAWYMYDSLYAGALFGLCWLQTMVAVDHGRLIALAVPFVVPYLVNEMPLEICAVYGLAMTFWPVRMKAEII